MQCSVSKTWATREISCEGWNSASAEICSKTATDFNEVNPWVVKGLE